MKTILNSTLLAILVISFGTVNAQTNLSFDKIRVAGASSVELKQGTATSITFDEGKVTGIEKVYSISGDGWLTVTGKTGEDIQVTAPMISKIEIAGTGKLETEDGPFKVNDIELLVSGVGKIELNLEANNVKCVISGAGKIELEGASNDLEIDISGTGKVDAENLKVKTCTANISGSGKCLVNPTDSLTSNISGSGSVYYVTRPTTINKNISGAGKVSDANVNIQDTTKISLGKKKVLIVDENGRNAKQTFKDAISGTDKVKGHWAGFEMGVNMLVDKDFSTTPPPGYNFLDLKTEKSIALNFNLADYELKLYRRNIMLITGLGFTINNYRFKSEAVLLSGSDSVVAFTDPFLNIKKNKLVASYLTVPLLLEFNTSENPNKTVHLAFGVIGGLRLGSHLKIVKEQNGNEDKTKVRDDFNLNPWRYDATVRLGFRNVTAFASYDMANLFKDNKGPEISPLTVGLRLVGW